MPWYLTVFLSLIAPLFASAIIYQATKRRLCVVVPNLFAHTSLANEAQTIELMVLNRSQNSEEDIVIELNNRMKYELIASTNSNVTFEEARIKINRIPENDHSVIIFMCENGEFGKDSISSISSKTTKGKMFDKLENVPSSFWNLIGGIFALLVLLFGPMVSGVFIGSSFHTEIEAIFEPRTGDSPEIAEVLTMDWQQTDRLVRSQFFRDMDPIQFPFEVEITSVSDGVVTVDIIITNTSSDRIRVNGRLISSTENGGPNGYVNNFFHDALVMPGGSVTRQIATHIPEDGNPRIVIFEASIMYRGEILNGLSHDLSLPD